jgi:NAD(P)-dependent dehydrogenase (short-subunit alcohol dehydrogenase family)
LAGALALAAEGAKVVVSGRRTREGEQAVITIREAGGLAEFVQADVSRAVEVQRLVEQTVGFWGQLDMLINSAGIEGTPFVPLADYSEDDWDRVLDINLKGTWLCMKYATPHLLRQQGASIVNVSSIGGVNGGSLGVAYHASKHGVLGVTRAAAIEYGSQGLRINAVAPGVFATEMSERLFSEDKHETVAQTNPMKRWGRLEEIAAAIAWLCSPAAGYVNGHTLAEMAVFSFNEARHSAHRLKVVRVACEETTPE